MSAGAIPSAADPPPRAADESAQVDGAPNAELAERAAELEDRLQRALADLDNVRRRYDREVARERAGELSRVAAAWIDVVDNLERAVHAASGDGDPEATGAHAGGAQRPVDCAALIEGVRAVHEQAIDVLAALGFPRFEDIGARFDPTRHEAVGTVPDRGAPGTVIAAVRPGYGAGDAILRPAGVVVATGSV